MSEKISVKEFTTDYTSRLKVFTDFKNISVGQFKYRINEDVRKNLTHQIMKGKIFDGSLSEINGLVAIGKENSGDKEVIVFESGNSIQLFYLVNPLFDIDLLGDQDTPKIELEDVKENIIHEVSREELEEMRYIERKSKVVVMEVQLTCL